MVQSYEILHAFKLIVVLRALDSFALIAERDLIREKVFLHLLKDRCVKVLYVAVVTVIDDGRICRTGVQGKGHT